MLSEIELSGVAAENSHRLRELLRQPDPATGYGCGGDRTRRTCPDAEHRTVWVPRTMCRAEGFEQARTDAAAWRALRVRHDFVYWCLCCARIKDKESGREIPFRLNAPQRRLVEILEADREAGRPQRLIMLKARQWGGSTVVQMYMAWLQLYHLPGANSLICAHVKDSARNILGMYTRMLASVPEYAWPGECKPRLRPFESSQNTRLLDGTGSCVTVASSERIDAIRGGDYALAHLSETGFWANTPGKHPRDFIRSICGSVALRAGTLIVMESTANGVGSYFHTEWQRCVRGQGDKRPYFVGWHKIAMYRLALDCPAEDFARTLTAYEETLWREHGCCLEQINWYRHKLREYGSQMEMQAEYPTTADEAWLSASRGVFGASQVAALRKGCREGVRGTLTDNGVWESGERGHCVVWEFPDRCGEYIVSVDIGGRSAKADWSVVCVMRTDTPLPMVVAQWRGHTEHYLLARTAMSMAGWYNDALLVIESNTLESASGGESLYILNHVAEHYTNVYCRRSLDTLTGVESTRVGFHTNRQTKAMVISAMVQHVTEGTYVERDNGACDELAVYEQRDNGSYGAMEGHHDDMLMTRAIALYVMGQRHMGAPAPAFTPIRMW